MKLKFLALLILPLLAAFTSVAQLSYYSPAPEQLAFFTTPRTVAGGATSNYTSGVTIDGRYQENIALQLTSTSAGTNANNYTVTIQRSIDGTNFDTTVPHLTWVLAGNGTNSMRHLTNFATLGYGWFRVSSIANANPDTVLSNIVIRYSIKR